MFVAVLMLVVVVVVVVMVVVVAWRGGERGRDRFGVLGESDGVASFRC